MYLTFKFYNRRGQRLSVIGIPDKDNDTTLIKYIAHNKKDISQFRKKLGAKILLTNTPEEYPTMQVFTISGSSFKEFIKTCKQSFLQIKELEIDEAVNILSVKEGVSKIDKWKRSLIIKYLG